jgi:UDP-glucose 4-epimerase
VRARSIELRAQRQVHLLVEGVHPVGAVERDRAPGSSRTCVTPSANVAGADALLLNAAVPEPHFIDRFASGGGPVRSYIGPGSLARVVLALAAAPGLPPVLNVAAPAPVAMVDLARVAGGDWRWRPAPDGAVERLTLDCSALTRHVHFAPAESTATAMVAQWRACREIA